MPKNPQVLAFVAALAGRGNCFTLDSEGQGRLVLEIPADSALALAGNIHELGGKAFVVAINTSFDDVQAVDLDNIVWTS